MNKKITKILFLIIVFFMSIKISYALDYNNICNDEIVLNIIKVFGVLIEIFKIILPILLIIVGMIDFGKVVISHDEKEINKSTSRLIKKIIIGISIYFVPTIVFSLFSILEISDFNENYQKCVVCLNDTNQCK